MPLIDIREIHKACQAYWDDPILKPFAQVELTKPQTSLERLLDGPAPVKIIQEVVVVAQKKKIVQDILQANSVVEVADILDRCDFDGVANREYLRDTNSSNLTWMCLRAQITFFWQEVRNSRYLGLGWLVLPIVSIAINTGTVYLLGITLGLILSYFVLHACYAIFQAHHASLAFAERSRQLMIELSTPATQNDPFEPISTLLQAWDLTYDADGKWVDHILENSEAWQSKRLEDGSPILHTLLQDQNPNHSYARIRKLQQAVTVFVDQKYLRNERNETPMCVLNRSDKYGFKILLDVQDASLFQEQYHKINRFLESMVTNRKHTKALLLFEGPSGTGKSQTVMDYIGKIKGYEIHRWEQGSKQDGVVGGLEGRAGDFFSDIMNQARENPNKKFAIYLDNLDVICSTKGKDAKEWIKALAAQFSHYIDKIRRESSNIIVIGTTRSALDMDALLLDHSDRVRFSLPNELARHRLLQHAFMETLVTADQLLHLVQVTEGWSQRALVSIASNLDKTSKVSDENMEEALEKIRVNLERDFTLLYPHSQIILPKFCKTSFFLKFQIVTPPSIAACLNKLKKYLLFPDFYERTPMHTLLYGPPGGGKTTAIRNFCEEMNLPFVLIKSGISAGDLCKALEAVNTFKYALVFIDEIDGFPHTGELLKQMDGFSANNTIMIGATNKPAVALAAGEGALGDRFHFKVFVPGLTNEQRATFLKWKVDKQLQRAGISSEETGCVLETTDWVKLAGASNSLSMRALSNHTNSFWGEKRCDALSTSSAYVIDMEEFAEELTRVTLGQTIQPY